MNPVLAVTLQSMHADMARLDQVAMNLANAQTAGYKRDVMAATPFAQLVSGGGVAPGSGELTRHLDARPGTLKATGQALDLAISGPGWFEVRTAEGLAYTRQGNFHADAQGRLATAAGDPVMGTAGEIVLPAAGVASIDREGRIYDGSAAGTVSARLRGEALGQLKVVQFDQAAAPRRIGGGLFAFAGAASQVPTGSGEVRQGYLENANVNPMQEMVQLLQTVRHFESLQKAMVGYDEMLAGAIRKLGETS